MTQTASNTDPLTAPIIAGKMFAGMGFVVLFIGGWTVPVLLHLSVVTVTVGTCLWFIEDIHGTDGHFVLCMFL